MVVKLGLLHVPRVNEIGTVVPRGQRLDTGDAICAGDEACER